MTSVIQVDDRDPNIGYTGDWLLGGNPTEELDGTTHAATSNGSTITYSFKGTSITFFGTITGSPSPGSIPSTSSFSLDGSSAVLVTVPQPIDTVYRHAFYVSPKLEDGEHTLIVTAINTDTDDMMWFDYFEYLPSSLSSTPPAPTVSSTSHSISSTPNPVLPTSPSSTAIPPSLTPSNTALGSSPSPVSSPSSSLPTTLSTPHASEPSSISSVVSDTAPSSLTSTSSTPSVSGPADLIPAVSESASTNAAAANNHLGTILPAVLVPSILLLLALLALLLWRRRRAQRDLYDEQQPRIDIDNMSTISTVNHIVTPYTRNHTQPLFQPLRRNEGMYDNKLMPSRHEPSGDSSVYNSEAAGPTSTTGLTDYMPPPAYDEDSEH
ncbi:hypothetical protein C8Q75DRAFT_806929 [Abortiporus biennis]|nr:hypothetical protein C8Q75DRAFT_806929 [Abortiporus biennis]